MQQQNQLYGGQLYLFAASIYQDLVSALEVKREIHTGGVIKLTLYHAEEIFLLW